MPIAEFPPLEDADEDGLLAIGGDLSPQSLILAYRSGVFPWPLDDVLAWWSPPSRGVIFLDEFHISRSLERELKKERFKVRVDTDFSGVIERCAEVINRGDQGGTWINGDIQAAYKRLAEMGIAHSFESYLDNKLVGGVYGLRLGRFFVAESGFYREPNASKVAMVALAEYLKSSRIKWFDCQMVTNFSEGFGAREIPRAIFMQMLSEVIDDKSI